MVGKVVAGMLAASLVAVGLARADGLPVLGVDVGGTGVVAPSGEERFVTIPAGRDTVVARVGTTDGRIVGSSLLRGTLTVPAVAYDGSADGLSGDGRTLVLIEPRVRFPRAETGLAILDARRLAVRERITLPGDFSFDAVSPRGSLLYLIEYVAPDDPRQYDVRAYDLRAGRLLPEPVVDPAEPQEEMYGTPFSRVSGAGGRWAYTLYDSVDGAPFVHALDTVGRTARCIDLDELAGRDVASLRLRLEQGGRTISIVRRGTPVLEFDTRTFVVGAPQPAAAPVAGGGFPWRPVGALAVAVLAVASLATFVVRRRV